MRISSILPVRLAKLAASLMAPFRWRSQPVPEVEGEASPAAYAVQSPALRMLTAATDRSFAPLTPVFVAILPGWEASIPPARALRAVLLMAVLNTSADALATRVVLDLPLCRFLGMRSSEPLDPAALERAKVRMAGNQCMNRALCAVVSAVRADGLFEQPGFAHNDALMSAWSMDDKGGGNERG